MKVQAGLRLLASCHRFQELELHTSPCPTDISWLLWLLLQGMDGVELGKENSGTKHEAAVLCFCYLHTSNSHPEFLHGVQIPKLNSVRVRVCACVHACLCVCGFV